MNKLILWLILAVAVVLAVGFAWWWFDGRWRPKTITKHQAEIAQLLEKAGWVAPGNSGPKLYMIGFRSCPDCIRYRAEEFPKLLKAGVDIRLIMVARRDKNGVVRSTPAERTTVAELWLNRSWELAERWWDSPLETWIAGDVRAADDDTARTAVVEVGRDFADQLAPLLADNGVSHDLRYPTLIWWTKDGVMRACVCERPETWRFVRAEVGIKRPVTY
jgi:hypothetical protein